jgi:hypothetical protein
MFFALVEVMIFPSFGIGVSLNTGKASVGVMLGTSVNIGVGTNVDNALGNGVERFTDETGMVGVYVGSIDCPCPQPLANRLNRKKMIVS